MSCRAVHRRRSHGGDAGESRKPAAGNEDVQCRLGRRLRGGFGATVREHTLLAAGGDVRAVTRYYYQHAEPNRVIAALAPAVLRLAAEGDPTAQQVVIESAAELLELALRVSYSPRLKSQRRLHITLTAMGSFEVPAA